MKALVSHESTQSSSISSRSPRLSNSWACLAFGFALMLVADGRDTAALAMWPAQALLLRFLRTQPIARGLAVLFVLRILVIVIAFRGMIPIPLPYYYFFLVIAGLSGLIPYALDRWIAPRFPGFSNTLIFPLALTVSQWVYGHGPMGSWGSIAYSQTGSLALEQLVSITGLSGIVFLIGWFASTVNWAWEGREFRRLGAIIATLGAVVLFGELRLAFFPPAATTVRVASLSRSPTLPQPSDALTHKVAFENPSSAEIAAFRSETAAVNDDLLARTELEARSGAKLIFWAEGNGQLLKQDESALLARSEALARKYGAYVVPALYVWTPGAPKPLENKVVMIGPDGAEAWQYWKSRPTPGPEMAASIKSDGRLRMVDTPYGRLTAAICYDMDFPTLLIQAGRTHADLVLSPANDWQAIDPRHTEIASFRAIEEGFNLVRQSSGGLSAAYDYEGRVIAASDSWHSANGTLVAEVPTRGTRTVYSILGDWVVWPCGAGLLVFIGMRMRRRSHRSENLANV